MLAPFVPHVVLPALRHSSCTLLLTAGALLALGGCTPGRPVVQADNPELATYVQLIMPARIEVQRYLTKPVSYAGDGNADGLEVILAAYDSFDDPTKVVGTFHFELQTRDFIDRVGTRVAFWPVEIDSEKTMRMYRDRYSRFYHFPLQLEEQPLPAGRYVLNVWLHLPTGQRLFDEYEFSYDGQGAPTLKPL